jgi:hypothetical protein
MDHELASIDLDMAPNEASGLLPVADRPLLEDYPQGAHTMASHWRCRLPEGRRSGHLAAERVREFPDMSAIEGIAVDHRDRIFYVSDEDEGVVVKHTHLIAAVGRTKAGSYAGSERALGGGRMR